MPLSSFSRCRQAAASSEVAAYMAFCIKQNSWIIFSSVSFIRKKIILKSAQGHIISPSLSSLPDQIIFEIGHVS